MRLLAWSGLRVPTLLGAVLLSCTAAPRDEASGSDPAVMEEIAEAVSRALPLSLSPARLEEPSARASFEESVRILAHYASVLADHGRGAEAGFEYLSRSLARDARDALRRLEAGHEAEAQFIVNQLVEDCVACHSRLPAPDESVLGCRLLERVDPELLGPKEWARLAAATRQFDAALDHYERLFRSPGVPPGQLDLEGLIVDYLTVCIRVKGDLRRPSTPLSELASRPDVPAYLEQDLRVWIAELGELGDRRDETPPLVQARALVREATLHERATWDRRGLIHALVASGLLHRYVMSAPASAHRLAEAYYLLGLTETWIRHSYWLSEADVYLESAIRAAPGTGVARAAFELLEQHIRAGFTGTSGLHLPEEVRLRLEELRALAGGPATGPPDRPGG